MDSFVRYYELHPQPLVVMVDGSAKEAQFGYCTFISCKKNVKLGIEWIDFALVKRTSGMVTGYLIGSM